MRLRRPNLLKSRKGSQSLRLFVLVNKIFELIGKNNFHIIPLVKGNIQEVKVQMISEDNYRVLSKYLTENKKQQGSANRTKGHRFRSNACRDNKGTTREGI